MGLKNMMDKTSNISYFCCRLGRNIQFFCYNCIGAPTHVGSYYQENTNDKWKSFDLLNLRGVQSLGIIVYRQKSYYFLSVNTLYSLFQQEYLQLYGLKRSLGKLIFIPFIILIHTNPNHHRTLMNQYLLYSQSPSIIMTRDE